MSSALHLYSEVYSRNFCSHWLLSIIRNNHRIPSEAIFQPNHTISMSSSSTWLPDASATETLTVYKCLNQSQNPSELTCTVIGWNICSRLEFPWHWLFRQTVVQNYDHADNRSYWLKFRKFILRVFHRWSGPNFLLKYVECNNNVSPVLVFSSILTCVRG